MTRPHGQVSSTWVVAGRWEEYLQFHQNEGFYCEKRCHQLQAHRNELSNKLKHATIGCRMAKLWLFYQIARLSGPGVPHVRHGVSTCEPTGAESLRSENGDQARNPPLTGWWCTGMPHVRHGFARAARDWHVRTHRCQIALTGPVGGTGPEIPLSQGAGALGCRTCETSVPNHSWEGRKCSVSVFGTRTCGTVWHGTDRHGLVVSVTSVT